MKKEKLTILITQTVLTAAVIAATLPFADAAFAQDLNDSVASITTGVSHIPNLISDVFYIAGAAMIGAGAMKLKAHAEQPTGSVTLGHGLGRIVSGTALLAIPAFAGWLNRTANLGTGNFSAATFGTVN